MSIFRLQGQRSRRFWMNRDGSPSKRKKALAAVYYAGSKLEAGREYTESEINDVIDEWTAYHDPATLRRELYNCGLLNRTADGRKYWLADEILSYVDFMARHL